MDRDEILEQAHFRPLPIVNGCQCRPLSATAYSLLRKFRDDSFAVHTVVAAFILAGQSNQVYRLAAGDKEAFHVAALEFGASVSVLELDEFAAWLDQELTAIHNAESESVGKSEREPDTTPAGSQAMEPSSPEPQT